MFLVLRHDRESFSNTESISEISRSIVMRNAAICGWNASTKNGRPKRAGQDKSSRSGQSTCSHWQSFTVTGALSRSNPKCFSHCLLDMTFDLIQNANIGCVQIFIATISLQAEANYWIKTSANGRYELLFTRNNPDILGGS
jgi:hypothetical protein